VVTGPGLPSGGVTLVKQINQTWFNITTTNPYYSCNGCTEQNWYMADATIASVPSNSSYTVQLYDLVGAPLAGANYTEVVPVAPKTNTAVAVLAYPSLTGMVNLANTGATNLSLSWVIPAGLAGDWLSVNVWQTMTNPSQNVGANISTSTGTATIAITAPASGLWTYGSYWISAWDQYGGKVNTSYQ